MGGSCLHMFLFLFLFCMALPKRDVLLVLFLLNAFPLFLYNLAFPYCLVDIGTALRFQKGKGGMGDIRDFTKKKGISGKGKGKGRKGYGEELYQKQKGIPGKGEGGRELHSASSERMLHSGLFFYEVVRLIEWGVRGGVPACASVPLLGLY